MRLLTDGERLRLDSADALPMQISCYAWLSCHTAESKRRLLAKCNASRRQIVNFFRIFSKYRLKKAQIFNLC